MLRVIAFCFFALAHSASVVPIDSSSVKVKQSGQEYSYTINNNHGFVIDPLPYHQVPVLRTAPENTIKHEHLPIKEQEFKPIRPQEKGSQFGISYQGSVAVVPAYPYLPAYQYPIPYTYGLSYPYNLITAI